MSYEKNCCGNKIRQINRIIKTYCHNPDFLFEIRIRTKMDQEKFISVLEEKKKRFTVFMKNTVKKINENPLSIEIFD